MGYHTNSGYMGFIPWLGRYIMFATEQEYHEYVEEWE